MEITELLWTINEEGFFSSLVQMCVTALALSSSGSNFELIGLLCGLTCTMSSEALFRQACALKIGSKTFNSTQMEPEPSQSWTKMTYTGVTAKRLNTCHVVFQVSFFILVFYPLILGLSSWGTGCRLMREKMLTRWLHHKKLWKFKRVWIISGLNENGRWVKGMSAFSRTKFHIFHTK